MEVISVAHLLSYELITLIVAMGVTLLAYRVDRIEEFAGIIVGTSIVVINGIFAFYYIVELNII